MPRPSAHWSYIRVGGGYTIVSDSGMRLLVRDARRPHYANAQIDDYGFSPKPPFVWRPPLRLTVRARASEAIAGTAGFGFWNNPFSPLGGRPRLPAAIWFFYASPPSDMPLALDVPGNGWKVASIDATQPRALAWAPLTLPVLLLNRHPALYRRIWPSVQHALRIAESSISPLNNTWCTYTLDWYDDYARFAIDDMVVFETDCAPRGPLGFVAWIDSQWAVVTPWGRFGWGFLDTATQWLDLQQIHIERL
ncbi:MAG: hypothetical protein AAGF95_25780 [Chloroflexota bacterium]